MSMYTYAFPGYDESTVEKKGFMGLGAYGELEPPHETMTAWKNRVTYVTYDIKQALARLAAFPAAYAPASALLAQAQMHVNEAAAIIKVEEDLHQWTRLREDRIDVKFVEARESYNAAIGVASTLGATGLPSMSTWTLAAPTSKSAGAVAPAPGTTPPREVPPTVIMMGMDPKVLLYGGLALGGLVVLTTLLRR